MKPVNTWFLFALVLAIGALPMFLLVDAALTPATHTQQTETQP